MVSLLTDDVRIISIIFGTYKSKDGASKYWQELYDVFPDININPVTITVDQHRIAAEIVVSGTQKVKSAGLQGLGNNFDIRGAFIYDFTEDAMKINEIRMYYDSSILKRQLDIHSKATSPWSS
jgi:predicted ester cyclase